MKESNVAGEVLHAGVFVIAVAVVLVAGWNEPLRYLFMKPHEIAREEGEMFTPPVEERRGGLGLKGTALDRAPYRTQSDGSVVYSYEFDTRKMGIRTETDRKDNMRRSR